LAKKVSRGLILGGGGARAAYQAGVLRHICEISRERDGKLPFEILSGVSAGAINVAGLAAHASSFTDACDLIQRQWQEITTPKVFETRALKLALNAVKWFLDLTLGGAEGRLEPRGKSLVDTAPLASMITDSLPAGAISQHIQNGTLEAVAISATDYQTRGLTVFVEARKDRTLWRRSSRVARYAQITPAHVLASCALPILFPAVRIGNAYFGDGSVHNMAPLSPAIHMGARKVLAIGVNQKLKRSLAALPVQVEPRYPSPAWVSGVLLDSIFLDALEMDREQMVRINRLLEELPEGVTDERVARLRHVDFLYLGPTEDLANLALKHRGELPRSVQYMLRGLGAKGENGGELLSYLLFESGYCRELLDLGYKDAEKRSDEISEFLWG